MGTDKAWLPVDGAPLVQRQVERLREVFADVRVSAKAPRRFVEAGLRVVVDETPEPAAIHGIRASLAAVGGPVFVLAVDLPEFPPVLAAAIARELVLRRAAAAVPVRDGVVQGLCAAYGPEALAVIDRNIAGGRLALRDLVAECRAAVLDESFWGRFAGPEAFSNWNRPEDHDASEDGRDDRTDDSRPAPGKGRNDDAESR